MFKKLLLTLFFISIAAVNAEPYDMSLPVKGNSIANDVLQFELLKEIYSITSSYAPDCLDFRVSNTQVIHYPYDVKKKKDRYVKGYWKELWTVDYCGEKLQIPVTFKINKDKTDYIIDKDFILQ